MKRFEQHELGAALTYAAEGGQALYVYRQRRGLHLGRQGERPRPATDIANCWRRAAETGEQVACLYDLSLDRLLRSRFPLQLCKRGRVCEQGTERQHLRLCGAPLLTAMEMCEATRDTVAPPGTTESA